MRSQIFACALAVCSASACTPRSAPETKTQAAAADATQGAVPIRLVLQITVDQLREDLPKRLLTRFGHGGFRRFYDKGVSFENAYYAHAITETAPGHATLFTGALPSEHGIIGNEWLDERAQVVFSVDDQNTTIVGTERPGKSPKNLLVPTIGDALIEHTGGRALVYAVSEKDRGAVLPGGRMGHAFWLDDQAGAFVTSSYYAVPSWLTEVDQHDAVFNMATARWDLVEDAARYIAADDLPYEKGYGCLGATFPHVFAECAPSMLTRTLKRSPMSDSLVVSFVRELLAREPLGRDEVPDLLAVSLSATDYVGHSFGPESREAEDNLLRLDQTLAELLAAVARVVPEEHVLVILSADHGIDESPEYWQARGKDAGRHDQEALVRWLNQTLRTRLFVDVDLVREFVNPSLWLHEENAALVGVEISALEKVVAELVMQSPGFAAAFTRKELFTGQVAREKLMAFGGNAQAIFKRIQNSVHPTRSGNVYLVPSPHWLLSTDGNEITAMHGTPWPYDAHVPILVLRSGLASRRFERAVDPRDIAPTIARLLDIPAPSGASGTALEELF